MIFFVNVVIVHVYFPFTMVSLSFGLDVRTWLGVAIVWATRLPRKGGGIPLCALLKDTTIELAGLFSTTPPKRRASSREAVDTIF